MFDCKCVLYMYTGDGVVAYEVAHLDGAIQITFDDVYHSISAPNLRSGGHNSDLILLHMCRVIIHALYYVCMHIYT